MDNFNSLLTLRICLKLYSVWSLWIGLLKLYSTSELFWDLFTVLSHIPMLLSALENPCKLPADWCCNENQMALRWHWAWQRGENSAACCWWSCINSFSCSVATTQVMRPGVLAKFPLCACHEYICMRLWLCGASYLRRTCLVIYISDHMHLGTCF